MSWGRAVVGAVTLDLGSLWVDNDHLGVDLINTSLTSLLIFLGCIRLFKHSTLTSLFH